ncbi:hypothetical protein D3C76_525440 [compost metagenome]
MPCWLNMSRRRCIWLSRASRTPALALAKVTWVCSAVMWIRTSRRPRSAGSIWISADLRFWLDIHITRSTSASLMPLCCSASGWPGTRAFTGRVVSVCCEPRAWVSASSRAAKVSLRLSAFPSACPSAGRSSPACKTPCRSLPSPASGCCSAPCPACSAANSSLPWAPPCCCDCAPCSRLSFTPPCWLSFSRSASVFATFCCSVPRVTSSGTGSLAGGCCASACSAGLSSALSGLSSASAGKLLPLSATSGLSAAAAGFGESFLALSATRSRAGRAACAGRSAGAGRLSRA